MAGRCTLILAIAALGCVGCRETTFPDPEPANPLQDKAVAPAQADVKPPHWSARAPLFLDPFLLLPRRCDVMHVWAVEEQGQARLCVQWDARAGLNANTFPDRSHFIQYDLATGKVVTDVLYKDLPEKPRPAKFLAFGGRNSGEHSWYGGKYVIAAPLCEVFADRLVPIPIGPEISDYGKLRWTPFVDDDTVILQMDAPDGRVNLVVLKDGKVVRTVKSPVPDTIVISNGKTHIALSYDEGSTAFDDTGRVLWRDKELHWKMVGGAQGYHSRERFVKTDVTTGRIEFRRFIDNSTAATTTAKGFRYANVACLDNVAAMFTIVTDTQYQLLAFLDGKLVVREPCLGMILLRAGKFPLVGDYFKVHSLRDGRVAKISGAPRFVIHGSVVSVGEDDDRVFVEPLNFK